MVQINADLSSVKAQEGFDPIPAGDYEVMVTDSSVVQTKNGGWMLKVTLTVNAGPFMNRKVFDNFVLGNEVALSRLKALATGARHPSPDFISDSEELHGKTLGIRVKVVADPSYPPQNKIVSFKALTGAIPMQNTAPVVPSFAPPGPPPTTPPFQFQGVSAAPIAATAAPMTKPPFSAPTANTPAQPPVAAPSVASAPVANKLPWE